ncbi:hypothetical protein [Maritimibacter sp. HL-12]|jgi:hypothetical protein|uniref:hypothetical protein n=1 Tax=Maritimibacter sp. HL-12 TaxID=1162418 RepID=UPI000A0EF881|nr:hypothetical protein [Maritimibacter sp. HL-12]SMH54161.1 hypothetical protein SAMN05661107_2905 [Maritimibacter sp. HL-12]
MSERASLAPIAAGLLALCLAAPLAAQMQIPAPPVPGPYPLMPVPMAAPSGQGQPPAMTQRFGPPAGLQLPYWMRQPADDGVGVDVGNNAETTPPRFAPSTLPGPGYGRATGPDFFPGYAAPGGGSTMPGPGATGVMTAPPAGAPGGYQPQPYRPAPGWGWGAPQGWRGGQ